ncbi:MAG TPA: hypothetical protein PKJ16_14880, partial [Spirochaetota bacterium]|nr:hypothetical protein [Spirochaetota bacterium]
MVIRLIAVSAILCGSATAHAAAAKCVRGTCANGQGTLAYSSGDTYTGFFVNGERSGFGTYAFLRGDTYTGQWRKDEKNGRGIYRFVNGESYDGEFRD